MFFFLPFAFGTDTASGKRKKARMAYETLSLLKDAAEIVMPFHHDQLRRLLRTRLKLLYELKVPG